VESLALIVQEYVSPAALGHLSNERRVARREDTWLYEQHWPTSWAATLRVPRQDIREGHARLELPHNRSPVDALDPVAEYLSSEDARYHAEWVSDGSRLWIVQADAEFRATQNPPCSAWFKLSAIDEPFEGRLLLSVQEAKEWKKAEDVRQFRRLGLPS